MFHTLRAKVRVRLPQVLLPQAAGGDQLRKVAQAVFS
jgi:hypothetical protein